ncbi:hypothetical protein BCR44DRAFT_1425606 [Catenaria anguillulae PL171]|uniref:Uncharacterized protein n=1 Tax=Catenaria anguillulae PL171 TaxID=765915 RepID=A0A1Y2HZ38_9FUNG|nr:hypothetical protein BCR44DRAFT_1425606 [Catenaria anguillulae PL171]
MTLATSVLQCTVQAFKMTALSCQAHCISFVLPVAGLLLSTLHRPNWTTVAWHRGSPTSHLTRKMVEVCIWPIRKSVVPVKPHSYHTR